jgi:site-specific DNA-adenine methylase
MEVGQTITQNDINKRLFERLDAMDERYEKFQKELKEESEKRMEQHEKRMEKFEREQRESSQKFESRIYAQMNWSLAIFTVIMVGVLSKLIMH